MQPGFELQMQCTALMRRRTAPSWQSLLVERGADKILNFPPFLEEEHASEKSGGKNC
jgi:hypothetical protein